MNTIFRSSCRREAGAGLVELMVALVLSLFLLAGLFTIFFSTKSTYNDQNALSALQDNQTLAASVLAQTVRSAGFFPYSTTGTTLRSAALPANTSIINTPTNATWSAGQAVYATGSTAGPDVLYVRMIPSPATDCLGNNTTAVEVNEFSLITTGTSAHSLACTTQTIHATSTAQALVSPLGTLGVNSTTGGGVQNMQVLFGVSTTGGTSVVRYYAPTAMPAGSWQNARSVIVKLTFFNPLFDAMRTPGTSCADRDSQGQPRCLYMTRVITLENQTQ